MLKPKTNKEELKRLRSTLMTGAEIRLTYATETCCNKNCIPNLIRGGRPGKVFNSSSDTSSAARYDNYLYCQQIGVPTEDIPSIAFDQFLKEIRQPIHALQAGAVSEAEANEQLRYYLVQKFTENRIYDDSDNKHNHLYLYQLHSLSRGIITVCKMAYIIITGVSVQAIEYSQRLVRNNVSAESIILGKSDQPTKTKGDSLKEAFEQFHLDYYRYQQNINHFVDIMKIPDSPTAFMCVTFLAEWFELAGEQEVCYII